MKEKKFKNIADEAMTQCLYITQNFYLTLEDLFWAYKDKDLYHKLLLYLRKKETIMEISRLRCS